MVARKESTAGKQVEKPRPQPLPSTFSKPQAKKAVDALYAHHAKVSRDKEESELLPQEEYVWLVVNLKRGSTRAKVMPVRVQLPHPPLPPPPATSVCLFTKDPQREYKDLLASPEVNVKFINRVVGVNKLKGKFKPFEPRRELMREHELFLCDERISGLVPGLLGKMFFEAKKVPIPVNLKRKDLKAELARAISSTYYHPTTGTSVSVRIATPSSSSTAQAVDNLLEAIPQIVALIPDGWDNILSLGVKTSNSVFLPVYSAKLEGRFDGDGSKSAATSKEDSMEVEEEQAPPAAQVKKAKTTSGASALAPDASGSGKPKDRKKSSTIGSGAVARKGKQGLGSGSSSKPSKTKA